MERPTRPTREQIVMMGMFALGPYIESLHDYIDYLQRPGWSFGPYTAAAVNMAEVANWLFIRWGDQHDNDHNALRDDFETYIVKAVPSLSSMTTSVDRGTLIVDFTTDDGDDQFRYGLSLDLFNDEDDPDEAEEDEEDEEVAA